MTRTMRTFFAPRGAISLFGPERFEGRRLAELDSHVVGYHPYCTSGPVVILERTTFSMLKCTRCNAVLLTLPRAVKTYGELFRYLGEQDAKHSP